MTVTFDRDRGGYVLPMTDKTRDALAWIADRYPSAAVLWDGARHEPAGDDGADGWELIVPEHVAWAYRDELPEDNGNPDAVLPPCAGGPLAEVLLELFDTIV